MKLDLDSKHPHRTLAVICLVLFASTACKDGNTITSEASPPAAKPAVTPTPPVSFAGSQWDLSSQVVGDTGPDFCIWTAKVGMVFHGTYTITRNGNSVSFVPADIVDWESYQATIQGASFAASHQSFEGSQYFCTRYGQSASLSGSFSPDGNRLTATEIWTFTPDSGQVKTVTFQWSATRR
jgi:hypothetical protein